MRQKALFCLVCVCILVPLHAALPLRESGAFPTRCITRVVLLVYFRIDTCLPSQLGGSSCVLGAGYIYEWKCRSIVTQVDLGTRAPVDTRLMSGVVPVASLLMNLHY